MMTTELAPTNGNGDAAVMEAVIVNGDLAKLTPAQRVDWYRIRCAAAGLDPRTQPFQYITLQGKLTLYATKTATEQLCAQRNITTSIVGRERADDLYIVTCRAAIDARYTESIGAVSIAGLKGEALANALMKAETKAKRRAVLALSGLGMLDETEAEDIPASAKAQGVTVDVATGEVLSTAPALPPATHRHDVAFVLDRIEKLSDLEKLGEARQWVLNQPPSISKNLEILAALDRARDELVRASAQLGEVDDEPDDDGDGPDMAGSGVIAEGM